MQSTEYLAILDEFQNFSNILMNANKIEAEKKRYTEQMAMIAGVLRQQDKKSMRKSIRKSVKK